MSKSSLPFILQPADVGSWVSQPGRRVIWFHSLCDGPGVMAMRGWRELPEEMRERVTLRLVLIDDIPNATQYEFGMRWNLRHMSELTVWENGDLLWRGVPFAGPGRVWNAWLAKWGLV